MKQDSDVRPDFKGDPPAFIQVPPAPGLADALHPIFSNLLAASAVAASPAYLRCAPSTYNMACMH